MSLGSTVETGPTRASELRGRVSPRLLLLLVVGDILGAGIYVLIGELAGLVGGMAWAAFGGAFVIALTSATSYAELVTRYPGAAGSALYAQKAFHSPTVTAAVGFAVLVASVATAATTARAFAGEYLSEFVDLPTTPVAVLVVVVLGCIAALGIEASARANATLTLVEMGGLLLIIAMGVGALFEGQAEPGALVDPVGASTSEALGAVALAFFAFLGFEDAVHISEEVEDPQRTFPRVLLSAVLITGLVYLLVGLTAGLLVDPAVLAASDGPLLEVAKAGPFDVANRLFAGIALGAVTNTSLFALVAAARLLYGMARAGDLPEVLGQVSARRGSPVAAVAVVTSMAAVLTATGAVGDLAQTAVTALLAVLCVVNVAAIQTRHEIKGWRPPGWIAWLGASVSGLLLVHELATSSRTELVRLGLLVGLGAAARMLRSDSSAHRPGVR